MEETKLPARVLLLAAGAIAISSALAGFLLGIWLHPNSTNIAIDPLVDPIATPLPVPTKIITLDIEGAVNRPGVVQLIATPGAVLRLQDALTKAGGLAKDADESLVARTLNLAAPVVDGSKLYVPKKGEVTASPTTSTSVKGDVGKTTGSSTSTVSINAATKEELTHLSGIGEVRAQNIIDNRPYSSLDELHTKAKLPASTLEKIKNEISL